jgi:hypothetical protein
MFWVLMLHMILYMIQWKHISDYLNFSELFGVSYLCIHYLFIYIYDALPWIIYFELEILTAVTMKNTVLWYVMSHSLVDVKRCFTGTYCHIISVMEHILLQFPGSEDIANLFLWDGNGHLLEDTALYPRRQYLIEPLSICCREHINIAHIWAGTDFWTYVDWDFLFEVLYPLT